MQKIQNKYTTADIARTLSVTERTIRRRIEKLISTKGGKYEISEEIFELIKQMGDSEDNLRTSFGHPSDTIENDFEHTEYFTAAEYQEFRKRLSEYPLLKEQLAHSKEYLNSLKNEIEYHKTAYWKQLEIHEKMIGLSHQRNFIEAKEKGIKD